MAYQFFWEGDPDTICEHGAWKMVTSGDESDGRKNTASAIAKSARKGCSACKMLIDVVDEFRPGWIAAPGKRELEISWRTAFLEVNLIDPHGSDEKFELLCRSPEKSMYPPGYETKCIEEFLHTKLTLDITEHSGSKAAFERINTWLSYCVDHDDRCGPPSADFKPSRLISVVDPDGSRGSNLFLFEPDHPVQYACLSYCWGSDLRGVRTTTTENISAHLNNIDFAQLPKTIQDAVTVCRELTIPNIWIDAICIVQDDPDDWLREAALMLDVYANSYLTIYANNADSCKLGFLGTQWSAGSWQRSVGTRPPADREFPGTEFIMRTYGDNPNAEQAGDNNVLSKRGWCLQEKVLPNRRVFFNGNELSWECSGRFMCECGHWTNMNGPMITVEETEAKFMFDIYRETRLQHLKAFLLQSPVASPQSYDSSADWRELVREYSARLLTRSTDKFPAISGLANMIQQSLNRQGLPDQYCAGLWLQNFVAELSWQVRDEAGEPIPHRRTEAYVAPSWSWASLHGAVEFRSHDTLFRAAIPRELLTLVTHATVKSVNCNSAEYPTGRLSTRAYVDLVGPLVPVDLLHVIVEDEKFELVKGRNSSYCGVQLDFEMKAIPRLEGVTRFGWENGTIDRDGADPNLEFFCLQLFTWEDRREGEKRNASPETWFLVLMRKRGATTYERIGIGHHFGKTALYGSDSEDEEWESDDESGESGDGSESGSNDEGSGSDSGSGSGDHSSDGFDADEDMARLLAGNKSQYLFFEGAEEKEVRIF